MDGKAPSLVLEGVRSVEGVAFLGDDVYLAVRRGYVVRLRGGEATFLEREPGPRNVSIVVRAGRVWVSADERIGYLDGEDHMRWTPVPAGGPLAVDSEGSLWMGSFLGLTQYPEPDTRIWGREEGMSKAHTRFVSRLGDGVAVTSWNEPKYRVADPEADLEPLPGGKLNSVARPCSSQQGELVYLNSMG